MIDVPQGCISFDGYIFYVDYKRYSMRKILGKGRHSVIAQADDVLLNREVALKQIENVLDDDQDIFSVLLELRILNYMRHINITSLLGLEFETDSVIIITELCQQNLCELIYGERSESLTGDHCLQIFSQVLSALSFLHSSKIVHRDIEPSNILVCKNSLDKHIQIKICDFGRAIYVNPGYSRMNAMNTVGVSKGALWYSPPEAILACGLCSPAHDIWSAGSTFAEVIRKAPLFTAVSPFDQLQTLCRTSGISITSKFNMENKKHREFIYKKICLSSPDKNIQTNRSTNEANDNDNKSKAGNWLGKKLGASASMHPQMLDLISSMLHLNPRTRISSESALNHVVFQNLNLSKADGDHDDGRDTYIPQGTTSNRIDMNKIIVEAELEAIDGCYSSLDARKELLRNEVREIRNHLQRWQSSQLGKIEETPSTLLTPINNLGLGVMHDETDDRDADGVMHDFSCDVFDGVPGAITPGESPTLLTDASQEDTDTVMVGNECDKQPFQVKVDSSLTMAPPPDTYRDTSDFDGLKPDGAGSYEDAGDSYTKDISVHDIDSLRRNRRKVLSAEHSRINLRSPAFLSDELLPKEGPLFKTQEMKAPVSASIPVPQPSSMNATSSIWSTITSHFTGARERSYSNPRKSPPLSPKSAMRTPLKSDTFLDISNPIFQSEGEKVSQFTNPNPMLIQDGLHRSNNINGSANFKFSQKNIAEFTNPLSMAKPAASVDAKLTTTTSGSKGMSPALRTVGKTGLLSKVAASSATGAITSSLEIEFHELFEPVDIEQLNDASRVSTLSPPTMTRSSGSSENLFPLATTHFGGLTSTSPAGSRRSSPARMCHRGSLSPLPHRRSVSPGSLPPLPHRGSSSSLADDFNASIAQSPKSIVNLGALPYPRRDMSPLRHNIGEVEPKDPFPSTRVGSPFRLTALGDRERRSANNLVDLHDQCIGSPLTIPVLGSAKALSPSGTMPPPNDRSNISSDMTSEQDDDWNHSGMLRGGSIHGMSKLANKREDFGVTSPTNSSNIFTTDLRSNNSHDNLTLLPMKVNNTTHTVAEKTTVGNSWKSRNTLSPLRGLRHTKGSTSKSVSN